MVLPSEVIIKQEKEDNEDVDSNITHVGPDYDFKIDVKIECSQVDEDWCLQSNPLLVRPFEKNPPDVVDYKTLTDYCIQLCATCNELFGDSYSLICHQTKHLTVLLKRFTSLKYQCDHCLQYFINKLKLKEHIETTHLQIKPLHQCKSCKKKLPYKSWHAHEREVHCLNKFTCAMCRRKFCTLRYFKRHFLFVHCGIERSGGYGHIRNAVVREKPDGHVIEEFEMREASKGTFCKMKTDTNAEVKCSQCPTILANKHALKTHMRNCHCEKVTCEICKSVLKKSYLNNHIRRVHYNDGKEHKCKCGKKFRSPRYLKIHIKNSLNKCR